MFDQYNAPTNYTTYDSSSLNQYSYKNLNDNFPLYQQYENLYHFTKQINPITLSNVNAQTRDPSNLPCDIRPTVYDGMDGHLGTWTIRISQDIPTYLTYPDLSATYGKVRINFQDKSPGYLAKIS